MKKATKTLAFLSALCMTASMAAALPVSAAEVKGDVDGDGYLTGHDAAVTSRYLHEGDVALTRAQLAIADVDGNGKVEQADADWMQANRQYAFGDADLTGKIVTERDSDGFLLEINLDSAYSALMTYLVPFVYKEDEPKPVKYQKYYGALRRNLSDFTGDNRVDYFDAYYLLMANSFQAVRFDSWKDVYVDGRYYIDKMDPRYIKYCEEVAQ